MCIKTDGLRFFDIPEDYFTILRVYETIYDGTVVYRYWGNGKYVGQQQYRVVSKSFWWIIPEEIFKTNFVVVKETK